MKVVLLQNVKNVGQKGEVKEVSEGFARNHLIPQGLAKVGTEKTLREVEKLSHDKEKHSTVLLQKIKETFDALSGQSFTINLKGNEKGALFAKFDEKNLLDFLLGQGIKHLEEKHISLVGSPIKHTGTYTVVLKEKKLTSTFTITIA